MARHPSDNLHALLAHHGIAAGGELSDADLENVVGGKALRRDRTSVSQKPSAKGNGNGPDEKLEKFFERQNQNTPGNRNQN